MLRRIQSFVQDDRDHWVAQLECGSHLAWNEDTGYIDHALIVKYLAGNASPGKEAGGPIYYMAGPPTMVPGLRTMLNQAGIDDDDIRTEEFTGY